VQFPITIGLRRSRFLDVTLLTAVILANAAILGFQCSPSIRACLFFAVLMLAIQAWRTLTPAIKLIRLERSGEIFIARVGENDFVQATPKPGATIHPWLTIVRLTTADARTATLIAAVDRKNSENLRRLRMFMRWQANFSAPTDDA
jgi:toxin CptA